MILILTSFFPKNRINSLTNNENCHYGINNSKFEIVTQKEKFKSPKQKKVSSIKVRKKKLV